MKNIIHCTSKNNLLKIKESGFKIIKDDFPPRFGYGIYFMSSEDFGYGDENTSRVYCDLVSNNIKKLTHDEIRLMYPELEIEYQEGGAPILEYYAKEHNFDAIEILYDDNTSEIVVYNLDVIKYKKFDIRKK